VAFFLPHNFIPRPYQLHILHALDSGIKRAVWVVNRRGGKDITILNWVIKRLWQETQTCFYVFPSYAQAKKAIWDAVNNDGQRILDYIPESIVSQKNAQEMKIRLTNGSLLQFVGSDNPDSLRGTNPKIVVFSEAALQTPLAWDIIRPIVSVNKGYAIFISTPCGRNHFWDLYRMAKGNKEWFCQLLTYKDTKVLTDEDIERERAEGMSDELIAQEYLCFPSEQYVMTSRGMIDIAKVEIGDLVFSHSGRWRKVLEKYERDYEGDLIRIKSYGSSEDILCTPNHPIRIYERINQSYRWMKAEFIEKKERLCFPKMQFGHVKILSESLVKLIAWFVTEGSSSKTGLSFSCRNFEEASYVKSIIDTVGFGEESTISETETCHVVNYNSTFLIDFLKIYCGTECYDKKIPLHLISGYEEIFLKELLKGDGCISNYKKYHQLIYSTTSKTLAYQVQILANSCGYTAGISKRKAGNYNIEGRTGIAMPSYAVRIGSVKMIEESTKLIRAKYNIAACVNEVEKVHFVGKVYNLRVQYDESYTINGRAVHNCSFERGVEGSYYAKLLQKMEEEGRICDLPYDEYKLVHIAVDLGWDDSTAIIFFQLDTSGAVKIIDYEERNTTRLSEWKKILDSKRYTYGTNLFPHDVEQTDGLSTGCTRKEILEDLGVSVTTVKRALVADGIETVRALMSSRLFINQKCDKLLRSIRNYHRDWDDKNKVYSNKPKHSWASHGCDALRYLAQGLTLIDQGSKSLENDYKALNKYWGS
jgi:intein/homing endonuclease